MATDDKNPNMKDRLSNNDEPDNSAISDDDLKALNKATSTLAMSVSQLTASFLAGSKKVDDAKKKIKLEISENKEKQFTDEQAEAIYTQIQQERIKQYNKIRSSIDNKFSPIHKATSTFGRSVKDFFPTFIKGKNIIKSMFNGMRNGACDLFGHLSKLFSTFGEKRVTITGIFTKVISGAWSMIKWVYEKGKAIIGWIWDKFVMLAKIGWQVLSTVWDIITTPVSMIWDIFKSVLFTIISSPIGLVGLGLIFMFAAKYLLQSVWPKMKDFFIDFASGIWDFVVQLTANIFTGGDKRKLEENVSKYWKQMKDFFFGNDETGQKSWFIEQYDTWIGDYIGWPSSRIKENVFGENGFINKTWTTIKTLFSTLYNQELFDEILLSFSVIKEMYYAATSYLTDDVSLMDVNANVEMKKQETLLKKDNENRISQFYKKFLSDFARSKLSTELSKYFLEISATGKPPEEIKKSLLARGKQILDTINSSKISKNSNVNEYIDSGIINEVINTISSSNGSTLKNIIQINEKTSAKLQLMLKDIVIAEDSYDPDSTKLALDKIFTESTSKIPTELDKSIDTLLKTSQTISQDALDQLDYKTRQNVMVLQKSFNDKSDMHDILAKNRSIQKYLDFLTTDMGSRFKNIAHEYDKENDAKARELFRADIMYRYGFKDKIGDDENDKERIDYMVDRIMALRKPVKSAKGNMFINSTNAVVGDGPEPELVLPINKDGVEFILNASEDTIKKLIAINKNNDTENKEEEDVAVMQKFRKMMPQKDIKMYDMKNLAHSVSLIG